MQEGELSGPFQHLPNEIDFEDAMKHFGQVPPEVQVNPTTIFVLNLTFHLKQEVASRCSIRIWNG